MFELRFAKIPDEPPPPPKESSSDDSGTEGSDESSSDEEEDSESEDKRAVQLRYLEKQVGVCVGVYLVLCVVPTRAVQTCADSNPT